MLGRKKGTNKSNKAQDIQFHEIVKYKNIPILILDEHWLELFPEHKKTPAIKCLEKQLDNLLKQQGKMVNDIKDMKKLKKKLMQEIVENMDESTAEEDKRQQKQQKSKQLIEEINYKVKEANDGVVDIPFKIKQVNEQLLVESMKVCYKELQTNHAKSKQLEEWIEKAREELKRRILVKQDMDLENEKIYSYMHDLLGAEVLNYFDSKINED